MAWWLERRYESVDTRVHDCDTGTLRVAARPVVLKQATHEEHVASVLEREPRLHAGATLIRGLDDHRRERVPAHDRIAHRERCLLRRRTRQEL
jgi:hypothetical protein